MRILILTHISPPAIDGGSRVIHKIGDYFQKKGHQVLRISSDCSSTDDFIRSHHPTNNQLPVYTFLHKPLKFLGHYFNLSKILAKGPIFKFLPFLRSLITVLEFRPNYIIAGPLPTTIILYAHFIKKITGAKVIFNPSFHPTDPEFQNPIFLNILKTTDYLWTLTDYETNYFKKIGFTNTIKLGNGVDQNFIINQKDIRFPKTPNLLFIGSLSAHKGIDHLIEIFKKLDHVTLTIAGQKTLYSSRLNLDHPHLKIIYQPSDQKIKELIDDCTALVLPSRQESFGLVLIEAMARGKPVLVNDIPQLVELISKTQAGLVFDLKNTLYLLDHPRQFGLRGLEYVTRHYTWDKIGKKLCQKLSLS